MIAGDQSRPESLVRVPLQKFSVDQGIFGDHACMFGGISRVIKLDG